MICKRGQVGTPGMSYSIEKGRALRARCLKSASKGICTVDFTEDGSSAPKYHQDEQRILELHKQTAHKLDLMRMYFGQYPSILAQAGKRRKVNADHIWIIDACCGAGRHLSQEHPLNEVPGTAIQACIEAQEVQRRFPDTDMHVRLIDLDTGVCQRLLTQTKRFREGVGRDQLDVVVEQADFAAKIPVILKETRYGFSNYFSLWFVDPFGIEEIQHSALDPLTSLVKGPELIINLEVANGVDRMIGAVLSPNTKPSVAEKDRAHLDALFGSDVWRKVKRAGVSKREKYIALAKTYADTFPQFKFRNVYMLHGEERFLVHLTHSKVAAEKFSETYDTSNNIGTLQGNRTLTQDRGKAAFELFSKFKGKDVDLDFMLKQTVVPLSKSFAPVVFRQAEIDGLGKYDQAAKVMRWNLTPQKHSGLPLLDLANHIERVKDPGPQLGLFDVSNPD